MAQVIVKPNRLKFNGKNYFRAGSEDVLVGSYGEKRTPIFGANYLEVKDLIDPSKLEIDDVVVADIDFARTRRGDLEEAFSAPIKGIDVSVGSTQAWEKFQSGELKLVKLAVRNNDMEDAINADADAIDDLRDYGNRARVAHQAWVVMSATLAEEFSRAQSFDVSGGRGKIKVTIKGKTGGSGSSTVTVSKGSTFAYLLASLDWNAKRKRKKNRVIDLDDDQWSVN
jgi:hypothetical protein